MMSRLVSWIVFLTAVFLGGCAHGPRVDEPALHLAEFRLEPFRADWNSDGPGKVFVVRNRGSVALRATVTCPDYPDVLWEVLVPAGGEARAIGQLMNRDQITNACEVRGEEPTSGVLLGRADR